jgi:predicted DNA-binding transcriptional regulator AlpA
VNEKTKPTRVAILLKADDVAQMLAISTRTLWRLVSVKKFPEPLRLGGSTRWRASDVQAWVDGHCDGRANDQQ